MNKHIRKLISFLLLEPRSKELEVVIGYLESIKDKEFKDWFSIISRIIGYDLAINHLLSKCLIEDKVKSYGYIFNNIYAFINEEYNLSFIQLAPFNNQRVASIKDYNTYILARETALNEYKSNKRDCKQ